MALKFKIPGARKERSTNDLHKLTKFTSSVTSTLSLKM